MKGDLHFDQFVKEQLSESTAEVPPHILENVLAARRRSKPKGFWFTFFGSSLAIWIGVLLLITTGGIYLYDVIRENKSNPAVSANSKSDVPERVQNNEQAITDKNINDQNNVNRQENKAQNNNQDINNQDNSNPDPDAFTPVQKRTNIITDQINADRPDLFQGISQIKADIPTTFTNNRLSFPFPNDNARSISATNSNRRADIKLPDCPTIESNAAGNKKYWEVYAGPDHVFGNYKTFGDTSSYNYLQKRKASTTPSSAFSAGVRYTKVFNNGMSVRSGLNYSQVNEKFNYVNLNEIRYITVITTRVIVRSPGDTLFINDTLKYQQTGTRTKTTYNRYRNIDVPLVVGYELGNDRIHANINAGVIINVYAWYKGDVLDTANQPVTITTGKTNSPYQFKTNIGVGFLTAASVYYKLNEKLHLLIEPYFRYNLSPMSKDNLNLQQKFHTVGVRAGIRMDLK